MTIRWMAAVIDLPPPNAEGEAAFWERITGYVLADRHGDGLDSATLVPSGGDSFLGVRSARDGRLLWRTHLVLFVENPEMTVEKAGELGARLLDEQGAHFVAESPGGLAFAVGPYEGQSRRPTPQSWPGGARSLVDQLCIDISPGSFEREGGFWATLTGWERRCSALPEFEYLVRPNGMPFRLLLQRLDDEAGGCGAHLDWACDDVAAESLRHQSLGAVTVRTTPFWTTLASPAGLAYCITCRNPDTGTL